MTKYRFRVPYTAWGYDWFVYEADSLDEACKKALDDEKPISIIPGPADEVEYNTKCIHYKEEDN